MHDDDFEPRLGVPAKGRGEPRYLSQVVKAARRAGKIASGGRSRRFEGSRIGRGAALARVLGSGHAGAAFRARRVVVKVRLIRLAGQGTAIARAHMRYIERDGVTRDGAPGKLYAQDRDHADGKEFHERCQGDRHQFRFIVSPEDGDQYADLKPFVRRLMRQMEDDLGTRLDWVAVDHYNTGHPHSHIVLRGRDDHGENLVIAREYISHGLRERACRLVTLDLGPRTDLEIAERRRADIQAERLTTIDRRLIRDMDRDHVVSVSALNAFEQGLRTGRLRKLEALGLAEHLRANEWRLAEGLEEVLRRMGERRDVIRSMQRELTARGKTPAAADLAIYDPQKEQVHPLVGCVAARGVADELHDRHYLIIDGVDGRTHYAAIGTPSVSRRDGDGDIDVASIGSVVRISPKQGGLRAADHTIVEVAAASHGRYSIEAHLRHDPSATQAFAETHQRRLEAMRRTSRSVEREPDGTWIIAPDHLDKVETYEARLLRDRPVDIEMLSAIPVDKLPKMDAATWLDRELTATEPTPLRDAGFGRDVRQAQAARRQWLIAEGLVDEGGASILFKPGLMATLQRRELVRIAAQLSDELGMPFAEAKLGNRIDGRLVRRVDLASGRFALIERARDFTLVPWRPVLEPRVGQSVSGIVREGGVTWSFGRQRSGPSIS